MLAVWKHRLSRLPLTWKLLKKLPSRPLRTRLLQNRLQKLLPMLQRMLRMPLMRQRLLRLPPKTLRMQLLRMQLQSWLKPPVPRVKRTPPIRLSRKLQRSRMMPTRLPQLPQQSRLQQRRLLLMLQQKKQMQIGLLKKQPPHSRLPMLPQKLLPMLRRRHRMKLPML
jgi:hypothetical protein